MFKPKLNLATQYYIEIDSAAIIDFANNAFEGIKGSNKWTFNTIATGITIGENSETLVFPVPANEILTFSFGNSTKHIVELLDLGGRFVDVFSTNEKTYSYQCSSLKAGIYICRITSGNSISVKKIIVE